jgi:hypothetical protein
MALDHDAADRAARVRSERGVSVADAHLSAVIDATEGPHAVLTSDTDDARRIAAALGRELRIVTI